MKNFRRNIIGLMITALAVFTVSAGGHGGVLEHDSGLTHDHLAATHSDDTQCHAAVAQEFFAQASNNVQVILKDTVRTYTVTESLSIRKPIAISPREKVPLFEFATIHTTTLALRV
ncbi:MAG: hypothetical protein O3A80_05420 [bacterium]|nr:hypothetical protein [bacterium]